LTGFVDIKSLDQRTTANRINGAHKFAGLTRISGHNYDLNAHVLQPTLKLKKFISNSVYNGLILDDLTLESYCSFKELVDKRRY